MTNAATIDRETLYVTDAEMIRRLGTPRDKTRRLVQALDQNPRSGFPKKQKLLGNLRHWPSVRAYFDRLSSATIEPPKRGGSHARQIGI